MSFASELKPIRDRVFKAGRMAVAEVLVALMTTWRKTLCLVKLGLGSVTLLRLQATVGTAKRALGERAYEAGAGDPSLRQQIASLDDQIAETNHAKKSNRRLRSLRDSAVLQLAAQTKSSSVAVLAVAIRAVGNACDEVRKQRAILAERRADLQHTDRATWLRVGCVYVAVFVWAYVWIDGSNEPRSNASTIATLTAADGIIDSASGSERSLAEIGDVPHLQSAEIKELEVSRSGDHPTESAGRIQATIGETNESSVLPAESSATNVSGVATAPKKPIANSDEAPLFGEALGTGITNEEIVSLVTKSTSGKFLEAGFKQFRFGASAATVQSLAEENAVPPSQGGQRFFIEDGSLVGYERSYPNDNDGYIARFRELFGTTAAENISESISVQQGGAAVDSRGNRFETADRNEAVLVRYYFPNSIAYILATKAASAQANIPTVFRREKLHLNIFDREWVDACLTRHVSNCREALGWAQRVAADEEARLLTLTNVRDFAGTERKYEIIADRTERMTTIGTNDKSFIVVERALKDYTDVGASYETRHEPRYLPRDTVSITIHFKNNPVAANPIYKYTFLVSEADRCHSAVAQQLFPPRSTTIVTRKKTNSLWMSYHWRTKDGWEVTVDPGGDVHLTNAPEKGL